MRLCHHDTGVATCECPLGLSGACDTCTLRVTPDGDGDGQSWDDAMGSVVAAGEPASSLSGLGATCELWLSEGTHHVFESSVTADTIRLRGKVGVYGGFAGDEASRDARHGAATLLDGDDQARHIAFVNNAGNVLDRLTMQHAFASGGGDNGRGAGVFVNTVADLSIVDCIIRDNRANYSGGGIYSNYTTSLTRTSLIGDRAGESGGAMRTQGGVLTFRDVVVAYNHSATVTGGIDLQNGNGTLTNLLVVGNTAQSVGGLRGLSAGLAIDGATIVGNSASSESGGLDTVGALTNSILWGNYAPTSANLVSTQAPSYCESEPAVTGTGDISVDPRFVHAPRAWDMVVAATEADHIDVARLDIYSVGDVIELGDDDVARTVTAIATSITFSPALDAVPAAGTSVAVWGARESDTVEDFGLATNSPCADAGDPTTTTPDLGGNGPNGTRDIGCYER